MSARISRLRGLIEQRKEKTVVRNWCKHYRATTSHETCNKGVVYDEEFMGVGFNKMPCFNPGHKDKCPLAEYPTAEEIAEREAYLNKRFENIGKARQAIVDHLGGPWKRGTPGQNGRIDCPICGKASALHFSRAGYNGHIHAGCETEGCVRWME